MSGFIVASNIKLFYPGLGSWDHSESNDELNNVIQILMKYTYAQVLTGGVGPFNFEIDKSLIHKFQLKRQSGGLLITVPGGQVIGYILKTVPKFPENQTKPIIKPFVCTESPVQSPSRKRRSILDDFVPKQPTDIKKLARDLFTKGLRDDHSDLAVRRSLSKDIEELIRKSDIKMDQLSHFIDSMKKMKGDDLPPLHNLGSVNQTIDNSFS